MLISTSKVSIGTSGVSQVIAENNDPKSNSDDSNIESLIPSTINAIPFP